MPYEGEGRNQEDSVNQGNAEDHPQTKKISGWNRFSSTISEGSHLVDILILDI